MANLNSVAITNQASEDKTKKSKVDWSTPYDEWLVPTLNRFRYGGPIECRAIPSEIQLNIESLIRTEKLKLLAEVRERVVGENQHSEHKEWDCPCGATHSFTEEWHATNRLREEQRVALTKLEAEL